VQDQDLVADHLRPALDRGIQLAAICGVQEGCLRNGTYKGEARLSHTVVVLADDWAPGLSINGGSLLTSAWRSGVQTVDYSAWDNAGIRTVRTLVDGRVVSREERPCDDHAVVPCGNAGGPMSLPTSALGTDGRHTLAIEVTDGGYNVVSASRTILIDNTAPGQPDGFSVPSAGAWRSTNSFAASWVLPPNQGSPIAGASYELCRVGTSQSCVRGYRSGAGLASIADLTVPGDGAWTLRLWLRDEAGNEDRDRAVTAGPLQLDRVPPTVELLPRDGDDPARIPVRAADAVSGVRELGVEVHRHGSNQWRPLSVTKGGADTYEAFVDDEALPEGTYDVRARAVDAAGNEQSTSTMATGAAATIALPMRLKSALDAGLPVGSRKRRRLDRSVTAPFGSSVVLYGRLELPGNNPVTSANLEVWERTPRLGAPFTRVGTVRTGRRGGFSFRVPQGASRIVRFRYPGTRLQRGATRDVMVGIRASSTIRVSPRAAVNGEYVTFRGRLRGGRIPPGGKLVELQVYTRRRWRTFAQPRASAETGRWSYPYRFEAITGTATFRFRARIRREALYPYEMGTSRHVRVEVHGL
jgi:hypothetical protein